MISSQQRDGEIASLLPVVRQIARRIHRMIPQVDLDDLMGDGSLGAIRAVDTFDAQRGPTLAQYASRIIAGVMLNGVRRWDPLSERARRELRESERERYAIALETGTLMNDAQLETHRPKFSKARAAAWVACPLSMDASFPPGVDLPIDWASDPARIWQHASVRQEIRILIAGLSERQQRLLITHYFNDQSLRSIARASNVSAQRISQLHRSALATLRKRIDASAY